MNRYTSEDESQPSQIAPSQLYSQLSVQPPPPPPPASETAADAAFAAAAPVSRLVAPLLHYCRSSPAAKSEAPPPLKNTPPDWLTIMNDIYNEVSFRQAGRAEVAGT